MIHLIPLEFILFDITILDYSISRTSSFLLSNWDNIILTYSTEIQAITLGRTI